MTDPLRSGSSRAGTATVLRFVSPGQAAAALTARVAADLDAAIKARGRASLAVPGGTTPVEFLSMLGYRNLDWPRIRVSLTDERWVPPTNARSNAGLVSRTFGRHARGYHWFPLWRDGLAWKDAPAALDAAGRELAWPFDVVVLGMGEDGHVASLFPDDETGFEPAPGSHYVAVLGPGAEPRISLRARELLEARALYVLISGARKLALLEQQPDPRLPVSRVLAARTGPAWVYVGD